MLKQITPVNLIISAGAMTGTAEIDSAVSNISYKDSVALQLQWTGAPVGNFQVQGCLDYSAGSPQGGGPANAGTWKTIPVQDPVSNTVYTTIPTSIGSPILLNLTQRAMPFLRVIYVNTSGTGVLTAYLFAKSLG